MDEFRFDSAASTPFVSAPSSPRTTCSDSSKFSYPCYRSAPTSPSSSRASASCGYSTIPFAWEDAPGTPRSPKSSDDASECNFAFQFNGLEGVTTAAADQLFEKGRIRPLKPPPGLQSPNSPKSPNRRLWRGNERDDFDPFTAAMVISSRSRKGSRSLSPRRREVASAAEDVRPAAKKWRLRDLFLFRSASEGRVVGNRNKDPVRKYTRKVEDSGFRTTDNFRSTNRAASEEMKKKRTALPFHTHGLFGCLRFNPAVSSIARRFS